MKKSKKIFELSISQEIISLANDFEIICRDIEVHRHITNYYLLI